MDDNSNEENQSEDETEPPKLKKARFIWEVKGNYHLKEENDMNSNVNNESEGVSRDNEELNEPAVSSTLANNIPNVNHCCVQTILQKTEEMFNDLEFPKVENDNEASSSQEENNLKDYNASYLLWHNRQMLRYETENKINLAIEACFGNYFSLDRNVSDSDEEAESDSVINDEGILMAIESHGLRTNNQQDSGSLVSVSDTSENSLRQSYQNEPNSNNSQENHSVPIIQDIPVCSETSETIEDNYNDFWNSALSAAISEKGLSHPT